eukprot:3751037-Alexandrium_andersonii.AAC.1
MFGRRRPSVSAGPCLVSAVSAILERLFPLGLGQAGLGLPEVWPTRAKRGLAPARKPQPIASTAG